MSEEKNSDEYCIFCDKSQFEERLCGEADDFWVIATLGQITDGGYVILVPKRHVKCVGAMEDAEIMLLEQLKNRVDEALAEEYGIGAETLFEHGIVGQSIKHAHLHLIPAKLDISTRIKRDFGSISWIYKLPPARALQFLATTHVYKNYEPYLLWQDATNYHWQICWNPQNVPMQYMRLIIAEALNRPERGNWRNMDPELDKKLWSETVRRLKPYF